MDLTFQSFLQFLRGFVSHLCRRWDQSARRLWYILAFLRSRFSPKPPKKKDDTRQSIEPSPPKSSPTTTVICASRLPNTLHIPTQLSPISGGHTPDPNASSPTIPITVRQATLQDNGESPQESRGDDSAGYLGVNRNLLWGSRPISRAPGIAEEPGPIQGPAPALDRGRTAGPPVITSRTNSGRSSRNSSRSNSQSRTSFYASGHEAGSQQSLAPHAYRSPQYLDGAEVVARGYLSRAPSPKPSTIFAPSDHPQSDADSVVSRVYRASRPKSRVQRPSPMSRRDRSATPASARQSIHGTVLDGQEHSQPEHLPAESARSSRVTVATSLGRPDAEPPNHELPDRELRPMIEIDRYEKHKKVVVEDVVKAHVLSPVTTEFALSPVEDWRPLMHPEGALYWVHATEPIYTDTDMCDEFLRLQIENALREIYELKQQCGYFPEDWELVLELGEEADTNEPICSYYFVRLSTRCMFWLHEFNPVGAMSGLTGVTEQTHIHLVLQVQYWAHWEMYPHNREVPDDLLQELLGILLHGSVDCMTSHNSTAVYSEENLGKLLGYVQKIKLVGGNRGFSACVVGRLMSFVTHARFLNFYGQKGARLCNDQTVYGHKPKRTYLIRMMSIFFFYAPELHLTGLESVYTDHVICQHRWAKFISKLQEDWERLILYGTVLLTANVSFLAIPSVDTGNHQPCTPTQLSSYVSIITSIGSIVIGLLLLRKHRTKPEDSADEVNTYLQGRHHHAVGFETLAILYSLPYALLLWSTLAFATAFGLDSLVFNNRTWAKVTIGIVILIALLLITWCIGTTIESREDISVGRNVCDAKARLERGLLNTIRVVFNGIRRGVGPSPPSTLQGDHESTGKPSGDSSVSTVLGPGETNDKGPEDRV